MKLIIGLGNPGKKYQNTRHNVGFLALDELAQKLNLEKEKWAQSAKAQAEYLNTLVGKEKIELVKPQTFMNESGVTVQYIINKHKLNPATDLIVIHDDKDLPLGTVRIQTDRGPAGHNGVLSIIEKLGTKNFTRVRLGVAGAGLEKMETADFVLAKFAADEKQSLEKMLDEAAEKIMALL